MPRNYLETVTRALEMIAGRFDSAWVVDHLQFDEKSVLEGFTTLTYFCALHPRLRFGNAVLCQSFRNPALLAKMAATIQFLSGGRFILGLGAGWHEQEYRAYGYDFPAHGVRVDQLEEAVQIIRSMWSGAPATFEGAHYRVHAARCEPQPIPSPPLMIGARKPRMLRLAARWADEWNVSSSGLGRYERLVAEFERACGQVGREPGSVRRSWVGGIACAPTQQEAEALAGDRFSAQADEDDFGFVGTPPQVVDQMQRFIDAGVDTFMLDCAGFPDTACLEILLEQVLPRLQG